MKIKKKTHYVKFGSLFPGDLFRVVEVAGTAYDTISIKLHNDRRIDNAFDIENNELEEIDLTANCVKIEGCFVEGEE